jgi:UDP-N-acetylglucosamine diphosphorylase/glucosamine-1-phosphate N-acetyltransferase
MKAVVLAAGEGSRMWPLAVDKPKHLLPVGGRPLIMHIVEAIKENSIERIFVVVGFKGDMIRSALGDGKKLGLPIEYLHQPRWTGTASALNIAFKAVGSEPFLAIYGDLWVTPSAVQTVLEKSRECPRVMGVVHVKNPSEYGLVELDGDRLVKIAEKPLSKAKPAGWVNTGIYVLDAEVFQAIERTKVSQRAEYELTTSLQHLLDGGNEVRAATIAHQDWMDVGRPWDLLEANERALSTLSYRVQGTIEKGAVLNGTIWVGTDSVVRSGCYIEGPTYIGSGCRIGPNARIRPCTSIQDHAVVGSSCEVKNSLIMEGTKLPHLSYVGDSILGENCNLGAGTITANIRFDEGALKMRVKGRLHETRRNKLGVIMGDRVQTGINVSILPGIRIGSGSWLGPGTIISNDVRSGILLLAKQAYVKKRLKKKMVTAEETPQPY